MSADVERRTVVVTGASGYLGRSVRMTFRRHGWRVRALNRSAVPDPWSETVHFRLDEPVSSEALRGASALVHCAWDFSLTTWSRVLAVNVQGSDALFRAAATAGVARLVFVSTMSAFEGCKSLYGRAKLEVERIALGRGALVLRPGLIYGDDAGGMFGRLVGTIRKSTLVPMFGDGSQVFYLVHQDDLSEFIRAYCEGLVPPVDRAISAAHEHGWAFRRILEEVAQAQGKTLRFLPIPWRPVWLVLRLCEALRLPLRFRSDSLMSLMNQNGTPSFELGQQVGFKCRPFKAATLKLAPSSD